MTVLIFYNLELTATISHLQNSEINGIGAASGVDETEARQLKEELAVLHRVVAESQSEVSSLELDLKKSGEMILDLERRLRLSEDEKAAFEKV